MLGTIAATWSGMMRIIARVTLTLCIAMGMLVTPPLLDRANASAAIVQNSPLPAKTQIIRVVTPEDAELVELATREASAMNLEDFRGGEVVLIITGTTLLIIALVVLIIILLR